MLVSVIVPTKNRCELLRETLASVQAQIFSDWETIVVDDGSHDGTKELVEAVSSTDNRIRYIRRIREPAGAPTCRNIGLTNAKGDYVLFLDSDDLLSPDCLATRSQILNNDPHLMYVVCKAERFKNTPGDMGNVCGGGDEQHDLSRALCMHYPWQTAGALWRRSVFEELGFWDESLKIGQDVDLMCRALIQGFPYRRLQKIDYYYRENGSGLGGGNFKLENQESHLRRIKRTGELLLQYGFNTARFRNIIAGNYFWIANNLYCLGLKTEAKDVWLQAKKSHACSLFKYYVGLFVLCVKGRPRLRQFFAPFVCLALPHGYLIHPVCEEMSDHYLDEKGSYVPVHVPEVSMDCISNGKFSIVLWCLHYLRSINHHIWGMLHRTRVAK